MREVPKPWSSCVAVIAAGLFACALAPVRALEADDLGFAEIVPEFPPGGPIEGELVLLHLRAIRKTDRITLEELRQPALTDVSWSQLGRDSVFEAQRRGFTVPGVERVLAIFPQRSGRLDIASFSLHLTVLNEANVREEMDMISAPVTLKVEKIPVEAAGGHWLPASALTLADSWDRPPDALLQAEVAHRTLRLEAVGLTADRLPPAPLIRTPGIIAFAYPPERVTEITPQGPVARVKYQWDIKPVSQDAADLPPIEVSWFDTRARVMRVASVALVRIKLQSVQAAARQATQAKAASGWGLLSVAAGALLWGLAVLALSGQAFGWGQAERLKKF